MTRIRYSTRIWPLDRVVFCPSCGRRLEADLSPADAGKPETRPDDISICLYCRSLLRFNGAELERLSPTEEHAARLWHPEIRFWLGLIREFDHARRREERATH